MVTSAFAVVVSVAFFLLIGSDFSSLHGAFRFTGDPFFRGSLHTEGIYAPQVKEDNLMAGNVSSKLLCALLLFLRIATIYFINKSRPLGNLRKEILSPVST